MIMALRMNDPVYAIENDQLSRLQSMDDEAWSNLLAECSPRLEQDIIASLRKRNLPLEHADDVQQKTWLTAVQRISDFTWNDGYGLYKWLRVISLKHVYNLSRERHRDISFEEIDEKSEETGMTLDAFQMINHLIEHSTEQQVELREHLQVVAQAIQSLEPHEREIFCRRFIYDEKPLHISRDYPELKSRSVSQKLSRVKQRVIVLCDMIEGLQ